MNEIICGRLQDREFADGSVIEMAARASDEVPPPDIAQSSSETRSPVPKPKPKPKHPGKKERQMALGDSAPPDDTPPPWAAAFLVQIESSMVTVSSQLEQLLDRLVVIERRLVSLEHRMNEVEETLNSDPSDEADLQVGDEEWQAFLDQEGATRPRSLSE